MSVLVLRSHLGLGDHIICNGLVRTLLEGEYDQVIMPVKSRNVSSVIAMFEDLPGSVSVVSVKDDEQADEYCSQVTQWPACKLKYLGLGCFSLDKPFDGRIWDREFYTHAGIPFESRWSKFFHAGLLTPAVPPSEPFIFLHEDVSRGARIDRSHIRSGIKTLEPSGNKGLPIGHYIPLLHEAEEIHCMESCFANLADSIPTKANRLVIHAYARDSVPPTYRKNWEILR